MLIFSINLSVEPGSLVAIVGQVGSGKTSLVSAALGEMWKESGKVTIKVNILYVYVYGICNKI